MKILSTTLLLFSVSGIAANAETVSFGPFTAPSQSTNFTVPVNVTQFDPSQGMLTGISFSLSSTLEGDVNFESTDASATTIVTTLAAGVDLLDPDSNILVASTPSVIQMTDVTAFDGFLDFAGTSGRTFNGLSASATEIGSVAPVDFSPYVGTGTVALNIDANGENSITGPGNSFSGFTNRAGASVTVTYTFDAVPEPSSALLAVFASGALALRRRRR